MQETLTVPHDLIADIGGTNARFARVDAHRRLYAEQILACADFAGLTAAATAYLQATGGPRPTRAAIAGATPITGDWIQFTNSHWSFSTETAQRRSGAAAQRLSGRLKHLVRLFSFLFEQLIPRCSALQAFPEMESLV
jgi:glucokinase